MIIIVSYDKGGAALTRFALRGSWPLLPEVGFFAPASAFIMFLRIKAAGAPDALSVFGRVTGNL